MLEHVAPRSYWLSVEGELGDRFLSGRQLADHPVQAMNAAARCLGRSFFQKLPLRLAIVGRCL
jgi:hypothetical protein